DRQRRGAHRSNAQGLGSNGDRDRTIGRRSLRRDCRIQDRHRRETHRHYPHRWQCRPRRAALEISVTTKYRAFSAAEFLLAAFVVIGHNVFRILPNEVPILFVFGLLSVRLRDGRWSAIGFKWPESWMRVALIALGAAALRICLGDFVIGPLTGKFWPVPVPPAMANDITGNPKVAALALLIVWTFAAFGEEISYRGYLLKRGADVGGGS